MVAVVVIYGISFSLDDLHGSIYSNGIIMGICDIVITFSISFIARFLGRKKAWLLTWALGATGCFVYEFAPLEGTWAYVVLVAARLGAGGANALSLLVTS